MVRSRSHNPCWYLADSRIKILAKHTKSGKERILLRLPAPSQAMDVARNCNISFHSEIKTITAISNAAGIQEKTNRIVLMIDLGDLREGIFFTEEERIMQLADVIEQDPNLELYGIVFNLTCCGSVLPTQENLSCFLRITCSMKIKLAASSTLFPVAIPALSFCFCLSRQVYFLTTCAWERH